MNYFNKYKKYKTKYTKLRGGQPDGKLDQQLPNNKKMIGGAGEPIEESDIMHHDGLVCILKPGVKKGIIIWTNFNQPEGMDSLCKLGLKTGKQLHEEGVDFGRTKIHPYIFFRAPYYSRPIDYTSVETEIISSYGEGQIGTEERVFIRVDPDRTFVFSSEIRVVWYDKAENMINNSKKTLSDYLKIINNNKKIKENVKPGEKIWYNLFSSEAELFPMRASPKAPFDKAPIERNSEILVSIPHLTRDYFVSCTPKNKNKIIGIVANFLTWYISEHILINGQLLKENFKIASNNANPYTLKLLPMGARASIRKIVNTTLQQTDDVNLLKKLLNEYLEKIPDTIIEDINIDALDFDIVVKYLSNYIKMFYEQQQQQQLKLIFDYLIGVILPQEKEKIKDKLQNHNIVIADVLTLLKILLSIRWTEFKRIHQ